MEIKSIYDIEKEYTEFINREDDVTLDLSCWLPSFRHIRPIYPGELVVVMADTGVGKTAILQNIAVCAKHNPTLLFEMELPGTLCFERFAAIQHKTTQSDIESTYKDNKSVGVTFLDHIFVCDQSGISLDDVEEAIVKHQAEHECHIVMVDYMGLLNAKGARSRYERLSDAAETMKVIAKRTNTIIIASTQVHRKGDDYPDELFIHDAKDSGSIENSAGLLLGAWRDSDDPKNIMIVKVLKCTKGEAGKKIRCVCDMSRMIIREEIMTDHIVNDIDDDLMDRELT